LRSWRDVTFAAASGLAIELGVFALGFLTGQSLPSAQPVWVQVAQMPGKEITDRLLDPSVIASTLGALVQAILFSAVALSIIYIYRLIQRRNLS
jgi:hypothetical protein